MEGIYLHRAQRKVQTYIHDPSGFLIHDTSDQEVKGTPCLRLCGLCDWPSFCYCGVFLLLFS